MVRGKNIGLLILVYRRDIGELSQSTSYKEVKRGRRKIFQVTI